MKTRMTLFPNTSTRVSRLPASLALAVTLGLLPAFTGRAAITTWSGTTDTSWSVGSNWVTGTAASSGDTLVYSGAATNLTSNNDNVGPFTVGAFTFGAGAAAYTITGNAITLGGNITNSSTNLQTINLDMTGTAVRTVTVTAGGGNVLIGGNISGAGGGFTMAGTGTMSLSGSNSYTGNTTFAANQTLNINSTFALGSGILVANGSGSINNTSGSPLAIANNFNLSNGSPTFIGTNNLSITGTTTISGGNRTITVTSGTLTLSILDADTSARTLTKAGNGTLAITGPAGAGFAGGYLMGAGNTLIGDKAALGSGTLTIQTGTLSASANLSGVNAVANEVKFASAASISGTNNLTLSGTFTNNGSSKALTNNITPASGSLTLAGNVYLSEAQATARVLTIGGSGNTLISGNISDSPLGISGTTTSGLTITSNGTTTLSGSNSYTGTTTLSTAGSVIALNNDYALGSSSVTMSNGVTTTILSTNGPHTYANRFTTGSSGTSGIIGGTNQLTFSGLIENTIAGNGVLTVNDTAGVVFSGTIQATREIGGGGAKSFLLYGNGPITISGLMRNNTLGDAAGFTYNGSSTLTISGSNTYTGPTTLNSGTMAVTGVGTLGASGSSALTVAGGILDLGTTSQTVASFNMSGPSVVQNGTLYSLSGTSFLASFSGTSTISASLAGSGATLQKSSSGKLILAGSNSYTGTTLITGSGMLQATQPNALLNTSSVNASNIGSTLAVNYGGAGEYTAGDVVSLLAKTTGTSAAFFGFDTTNAGGSATYGNNLTMNLGLEKHGTGTLVLTGSNSYTGATTVNVGTLQFGAGNPNALGSTSGIIVASGAALDFNGNAYTLLRSTTNNVINLTSNGTITGGTLTIQAPVSGPTWVYGANAAAGYASLGGGSSTGSVVANGRLDLTGSTALTVGTISGSGTTGAIYNSNTTNPTLTFQGGSSFSMFAFNADGSKATLQQTGSGPVYFDHWGYNSATPNANYTLNGGTWNIGYIGQNNTGAQHSGTTNITNGAAVSILFNPNYSHGSWNVTNGSLLFSGAVSESNGNNNAAALGLSASGAGVITINGALTLAAGGALSPQNFLSVGSGGSVSIGGALTLGNTTAATAETDTVNLTGGKLLVNGAITAASGTTGQTRTFNWTGGQLTALTITSGSGFATPGSGGISSSTLTQSGGVLAPGDIGFSGKTGITGNYTITSGTLAVDLGGITASTAYQDALGTGKYDQVAVTGTTTLGGNLSLNLLPGFTMRPTDTLTVLSSTAGALSGVFGNVSSGASVTAADGSQFIVTYSGSSKTVVLTVTGSGLNQWQGTSGSDWSPTGSWTVNVPNSTAYTARFGDALSGTSAVTVNLDAGQTVNSLAFSSTSTRTYTISSTNGSILTLDNGSSPAVINDVKNSHTVSTGINLNSDLAVNVQQSADTLTLSGNLNGSGRTLTLNGAGKLTLSGSNTIGATNVTGGTLAINSASALGTAPVLATAGTVQFNVSTSSATGLPLITATNGAIVNLGTSGITVNNPIAFGNGGSTNILTGPTSGTATLAGNISIASGFSPRFDAGGNGTTLIISGTITNTDTTQSIMFNRSTSGTILLTASNSFAGGGTWVNGSSPIGTVFYNGTTKLGTNNVFAPASILTYGVAGASLDLNGYNQSFQSTYGGNGNIAGRFGIITNSAPATTGTLTFNTTANNVRVATDASAAYQYLTAAVQDGSGAVAVVKTGTATMTFINNGSYSGGTTVNNGTLKGYQGTAFGSGDVTLNSGLFNVDFNTFATSGTSGALVLSNTAVGTVILAGGDMVLNGRPSNAGVSLNGSTQNAGGSNPSDGRLVTITGTTTAGIAVGQLVTSSSNIAAGTYIATIIDSTHFLMNQGSSASTSGTLTLGAVTNTTAQTYAGLQVNSAGNVNVNNNGGGGTTLTFNNLSGTASLTKAGDGTMVVGGTGNFSGNLAVNAGVLTASNSIASTTITTAALATLNLNGGVSGTTAAITSNGVTNIGASSTLSSLNIGTTGTATLTAHTGGAGNVKVLDISSLTISGTTPFAGGGAKETSIVGNEIAFSTLGAGSFSEAQLAASGLVSPAPVPEPGTAALLTIGAIGGWLLRRRGSNPDSPNHTT